MAEELRARHHDDRASTVRCTVYLSIAIAALVGTWTQNLAFFSQQGTANPIPFIEAALVNPAAASIGVDILFFSLAAFVWMGVEARSLEIRGLWIYIVLSLLVAVSVMFPLFLIARERRLTVMRDVS